MLCINLWRHCTLWNAQYLQGRLFWYCPCPCHFLTDYYFWCYLIHFFLFPVTDILHCWFVIVLWDLNLFPLRGAIDWLIQSGTSMLELYMHYFQYWHCFKDCLNDFYSPDFDAGLDPIAILPSVESVVSLLSVQRADFDAGLVPFPSCHQYNLLSQCCQSRGLGGVCSMLQVLCFQRSSEASSPLSLPSVLCLMWAPPSKQEQSPDLVTSSGCREQSQS